MANTGATRKTSTQAKDKAAPARREPVDEFDPEGRMRENPTYWMDLPDAEPLTRAAWLRHRAREFATWLHLAKSKVEPKVSEEEWIALSETALGPLPRPGAAAQKKARPAKPDARKSAREPPAHSPAARPGGTPN